MCGVRLYLNEHVQNLITVHCPRIYRKYALLSTATLNTSQQQQQQQQQ